MAVAAAISKISRCLVDINMEWALTYISPGLSGTQKARSASLANQLRKRRSFTLGTGADKANIVANWTTTLGTSDDEGSPTATQYVNLYEGLYPMAGSGNVRVTLIKAIIAYAYADSEEDSTTVPISLSANAAVSGWIQSGTASVNSPFVDASSQIILGIGEPWIATSNSGWAVSNTRKYMQFYNGWENSLPRNVELYVIGEGLASY